MTKIDKKILLVEDDEDFIYILEKKFTSEGFSVITAKDGQEGATIAEQEKPDLIISDMLMPKMDGATMGQKIRETNTRVPIIFLTNIKNVDSTTEVQKSDTFDYLIKTDTSPNEIVAKAKEKLGLT